MPKKAPGKKTKSPKLGKWKIKRQGETQLVVTLPAGMTVTGTQVTVEDLLSAIATHSAIRKGRVVIKCCSGNMAIA